MSADDKGRSRIVPTSSKDFPRGDWSVVLNTDVTTFSNNMDASIKMITGGIVEMMKAQMAEVALGYVLCESCERTVATEIAKVTGGRCGECYRTELAHPRGQELDVLVEGARSTVSIGGPRKRSGSRGNKKTRRKVEAAKRRALRRLRHAHPAEYELMLAYERARVGLDPVPLEHAVRVGTVDTTAT